MFFGLVALASFFGVWIGVSAYGKRLQWSAVQRHGGGFIAACVVLGVGAALIKGEYDKSAPASATPSTAEVIVPQPVKDHNYVMQDGMKYGYPAAISETDRKAGQAAERIVMVLYAGEREGRYQAHIMDGLTVSALECGNPCQYMKIMTYVDNSYVSDQVKVEHMAAASGSLGYFIMQDAVRGKLKQYGRKIDGKSYQMWVDENRGMRRYPLP